MSATGCRFRTVTILHTEEDTPWCNYLLKHFKQDQMKLKIETLNVSSFEYQNPAEIEAAVRESYAVLLLTTSYLLDYLERNHHWLLATLNKRDLAVTSLIAATLNISTMELQEAKQNFQTDISWQVLQINVDGSNIKTCIAEILQITDKNIAYHSKQTFVDYREKKEKEILSVFPSVVHETGEQVVLIFPTEKEKGSVTLHVKDTVIPVETLNPFCVTFKAPDIPGPQIRLAVHVHGNKVGRVKLQSSTSPHFTSVELMCQTSGASSKEELDTMLAETFTSSVYDDPSLTFLFSSIPSKVQSGKEDSKYPTLLHWTAANGLRELCSVLLTAPGSGQACSMFNCDSRTPADLAEESGYKDLSEYILDFNEMRNVADACDLYIQLSLKPKTEASIYQDMSPKLNPGPPPVPPKPTTTPPKTQPPPFFDTNKVDDGDTYMVPDHNYKAAGMCRSQIELIEIQEEFKNGNFTLHEAEMLFNAWKLRYGSGNAISFKEKQQKLQILRGEHKKVLDLHKVAKNKKQKAAKKEDKLPKKKTSTSSPDLNISDPIGMRKCMTLPSMLPSRHRDADSQRDRLSNDSGHSSVRSSGSTRAGSYLSNSSERGSCLSNVSMRSSTMSHTSTSSEESEHQGHRQSTYEQYLGLPEDPSDQPSSEPPPPLPPRRKIPTDSKASFSSSSQPRPVFDCKPQPPLPARKPTGLKR